MSSIEGDRGSLQSADPNEGHGASGGTSKPEGGELDLARRIRHEAAIADRPGQMERLEAIADEVVRMDELAGSGIDAEAKAVRQLEAVIARVRDLYARTTAATASGCSDDLEEFLADLGGVLDGGGES